MSWTMGVLAVNMFAVSLVSYSNRIFLVLPQTITRISDRALRFLTPIPFCSFTILSHCSKLFRIDAALRNPLFDIIASVLSTAYFLQRRGVIDEIKISTLQQRVNQLCADDIVPLYNLRDNPDPLLHLILAAIIFRRITPDTFLQKMLHHELYTNMIQQVAKGTRAQLRDCISSIGLLGEPLKANLDRLPTCIPRGHCITFLRYLLHGLNDVSSTFPQ